MYSGLLQSSSSDVLFQQINLHDPARAQTAPVDLGSGRPEQQGSWYQPPPPGAPASRPGLGPAVCGFIDLILLPFLTMEPNRAFLLHLLLGRNHSKHREPLTFQCLLRL